MEIFFYKTGFRRSPVEDFIASLSKQDQARFRDVFEGIAKYGLNCPRASFRQLKAKLWEIKFQAPSGGFRIAYVLVSAQSMVWLHAFKKSSQKTPIQDLEIAVKRMREIL